MPPEDTEDAVEGEVVGDPDVERMLAVTQGLSQILKPQADAAIRSAEIHAETERLKVNKQSDLIARDQINAHSRFRHLFYGVVVFGVCGFILACVLIATGHMEHGLLVLSHMGTALLGAFGGRGLMKKDDDDP